MRARTTLLISLLVAGVVVAGCATAGPSPSPAASPSPEPSPSATPTPSPRPSRRPSPSPSPLPSPSPVAVASPLPSLSPTEQAAIVAAFVRLASDPAFSGHIAWRGTVTAGPAVLRLEGAADVSGEDQATEMEISTDAGSIRIETVVLDGRAYARRSGGDWTQLAAVPDTSGQPFGPLAGPDPVAYLRRQVVGGRPLHRLAVREALPIDPSTISSLSELDVDRAAFEILIDDAGVPVLGYFDLAGTAVVSGQRGDVIVDVDYRFSRIGEPIVIENPITP